MRATRWAMESVRSFRAFGVVALCGFFLSEEPTVRSLEARPSETKRANAAASGPSWLARSPLRFEANAGQWDSRVRFKTRGNGVTVFITDDAMTITADAAAVTMELVGARANSPIGELELGAKSNFFIGNDPTKWRTDVPNFAQVRASGWAPGVDVVWHGGVDGLEYDLDVAAETDASLIALDVEGASALSVANDGSLEMTTSAGVLVQKPPRVVQDGMELRTRYRVDGARRVGFDIEGYDRGRAVLIDPTLVFSTYIGGTKDDGYLTGGAIAIDSSGNAYVTGSTISTDYPTVSAIQGTYGGSTDTFVTKLDAAGDTVVYSTYIGGSSAEYGFGIAVDGNGNAIISGYTSSTNYPLSSAVQTTNAGSGDAFVTKLNASGSALVYSTYLGGSATDYTNAITVDASGNAYITGWVDSTNFPTTTGAYQTSNAGPEDAFITKLTSAGALSYSTYLGGGNYDIGYGIAVDASGNAFVMGNTASTNFPTTAGAAQTKSTQAAAFVTKMNTTGTALVYSTYLAGGSYGQGGIALDSSGNAWVTGVAQGFSSLPLVNAFQAYNAGQTDAFVTEVSAAGDAFLLSSYLGGSLNDSGYRIAVDGAGDAYVTGYTASSNFPSKNALQKNAGADAFVTKISSAGTILYSTCLGGSSAEYGYDIAVDASGSAFVMGYTNSTDYPTVNPYQAANAGGWDVFVAKITDGPVALGISPSTVTVSPKGSKTFTAYGGSGSGYTYSFTTNASGGTINSSTGAYTAGSTPNVVDIVEVTDSNSSTATAKVTVGAGVSISPSSPTPAPKGAVSFTASGGSGTGFAWSFTTNASGGSINSSTGAYTAGATGSVTDVVHVADSLGNTSGRQREGRRWRFDHARITVLASERHGELQRERRERDRLHVDAHDERLGRLDQRSNGLYTAGSTGNALDTVSVKDSLGNTASVVVSVGAGVAISPSAPDDSTERSGELRRERRQRHRLHVDAPHQQLGWEHQREHGRIYRWHRRQRHRHGEGRRFARQRRQRDGHGRRGRVDHAELTDVAAQRRDRLQREWRERNGLHVVALDERLRRQHQRQHRRVRRRRDAKRERRRRRDRLARKHDERDDQRRTGNHHLSDVAEHTPERQHRLQRGRREWYELHVVRRDEQLGRDHQRIDGRVRRRQQSQRRRHRDGRGLARQHGERERVGGRRPRDQSGSAVDTAEGLDRIHRDGRERKRLYVVAEDQRVRRNDRRDVGCLHRRRCAERHRRRRDHRLVGQHVERERHGDGRRVDHPDDDHARVGRYDDVRRGRRQRQGLHVVRRYEQLRRQHHERRRLHRRRDGRRHRHRATR